MVVVGVEKMPKGMIRSSFFAPWQERSGLAATPAYFALRAQRLMREHGITDADLAAVVVKNRANGVHNPDAMFRTAVTADQVLASRMVCAPLHLWMLCSPNEGAAAVVLRRADLAPGQPLLVAAALRSHLPGIGAGRVDPARRHRRLRHHPARPRWPPTTPTSSAGLGPDDVDVVECQDTDAARELLSWAELGLCRPGDQPRLLADGTGGPDGSRPVNASGGLLSKGEPLGASALGQVVELVRQLRGECGVRQVVGAAVGLAHTIGRGANASVVIVRR